MERMRRYYDKLARRFTLERAFLYLLISVAMGLSGWLDCTVWARDNTHFYAGVFSISVGIFGVFHCVLLIRAIKKRRLQNESPDTL
jgi:hypothetical protein